VNRLNITLDGLGSNTDDMNDLLKKRFQKSNLDLKNSKNDILINTLKEMHLFNSKQPKFLVKTFVNLKSMSLMNF